LWPTQEDDGDSGEGESESFAKGLQYLKDYKAPTTFCTVDQVLGLLAYNRRSILLLPLILKSRIIFDEFHSYDPRLSSYFHRFVAWFDLPYVFSSATATKTQITGIEKHRKLTVIRNQKGDLAYCKRFRFHKVDIPTAMSLFDAEARTLWYVNIVRNAQDVGRRFGDALVHHSRRQYEKRVEQHKKVVAAFRSGKKPVRCVTTQIAELGIDISAGRLIMEKCPPADALQRIGRATLRGRTPDKIVDIYIYDPVSTLPYREGLGQADPFFEELCQPRDWSQAELNEIFNRMFPGDPISKNLNQARVTVRYPLRGIDNMATAILASDLGAAKQAYKAERTPGLQRFEFNVHFGTVAACERYKLRYIAPFEDDARLGIIVPVKDSTPFFDKGGAKQLSISVKEP